MTDRNLLYSATFLRALATGMIAVVLSLYLVQLQLDAAEIGFVVSAGLSGIALATLIVTIAAPRGEQRRLLLGIAVMTAVGGVALIFVSTLAAILVVAFVGMVNGMGRDRGATSVIEQAMLPATASDEDRTRAFAWYNLWQDVGHALGGLLAGLPQLFARLGNLDELPATRATLVVYALLLGASALLYSRLSRQVELPSAAAVAPLTPQTRRVLWRISALFAIDATAGGFLSGALLSYFFYERFGVGAFVVGLLFFGSRVANAASHLAAAWLARRIGLVNTMVFTHIPSSLLLMTVPFAPNFAVAALLFLIREGMVEMDVPTRQSYVMAVVRPEERTRAAGITQLVRMAGWAVGPLIAGALMREASITTPLLVGGAMKILYDVLLYLAFRRVVPPEEQPADHRP